jgi:TetR/AcrR family transcriptional regulator, cholesterol catabolism regulator
MARTAAAGQPARRSSRSKRDDILAVATTLFGRDGYEDSKWADVAAAVGIGSTALYHYFESKLHCLYVIMADSLATYLRNFERVTKEAPDCPTAIVNLLRHEYDLSEQEVLRNRLLIAEQGLVGVHRESPREEEARQQAQSRTRELEFAWATFLARAMDQGVIPQADPWLLTRAVLGLHASVWHWYRPDDSLPLEDVSAFWVPRCLAVLGLPPELAE